MKTRRDYRPAGRQLDPAFVVTDRVQLWRNGVLLSVLSYEEAEEMVRDGRAFVICGQAIGALRSRVSYS